MPEVTEFGGGYGNVPAFANLDERKRALEIIKALKAIQKTGCGTFIAGREDNNADAVPELLSRGSSWREAAALYYNPGDPVFSKNRKASTELEAAGVVRCHRTRSGGHSFDDYLKNGSVAGLIRRARRLCESRDLG